MKTLSQLNIHLFIARNLSAIPFSRKQHTLCGEHHNAQAFNALCEFSDCCQSVNSKREADWKVNFSHSTRLCI